MFSRELKERISNEVQQILKATNDDELPDGEIQFLLHIDGAEGWSWANVRNNGSIGKDVPPELLCNTST